MKKVIAYICALTMFVTGITYTGKSTTVKAYNITYTTIDDGSVFIVAKDIARHVIRILWYRHLTIQ